MLDYAIQEEVEEYLKQQGTVAPMTDGWAQTLNLPTLVLSQLPKKKYDFQK